MNDLDPVLRFFWQGEWRAGSRELRRKLYDCEMVFTREGENSVVVEDAVYHLRAGSVLIIPPGHWHESWTSEDRSTYRVCVHFDWRRDHEHIDSPLAAMRTADFNPRWVHTVPEACARHLPLLVHDLPPQDIELIDQMVGRIVAGYANADYSLWPVLKTLLDHARGETALPRRPLPHAGRGSRAIITLKTHLEQHYAETLGYDDFASVTGLAKSTVCNVFKQIVGTPPLTYLNDIRLNHACHMLRTSQLTVAEIAAAVGIHDANYFSRLFRKRFGFSPSQFIQKAVPKTPRSLSPKQSPTMPIRG